MTTKTTPQPTFTRFDFTVLVVSLIFLTMTAIIVLYPQLNPLPLRVAYMSLTDGVSNVWMADPNQPENAEQITQAPVGVYNFGVSPDGRYLAYAERDFDSGLNDLYLRDLRTGEISQLTDCGENNADCRTPVFHPEGNLIAYERMTVDTTRTIGGGLGALRIWVLDLDSRTTTQLIPDNQIIGHSPEWSADGNSIVFYSADIANPSILIYTFDADDGQPSVKTITSDYGTVGDLSPDGSTHIYPDAVANETGVSTQLRIANLDDLTFEELSNSADVDDTGAEWHPSGEYALIERRYLDDRFTAGFQIYRYDFTSGETTPFLVDERFNHSSFEFNEDGTQLIVHRFPLLTETGETNVNGTPEVWIMDMETQALIRVATNSFAPQWVQP